MKSFAICALLGAMVDAGRYIDRKNPNIRKPKIPIIENITEPLQHVEVVPTEVLWNNITQAGTNATNFLTNVFN
jgi:hypothetical protein